MKATIEFRIHEPEATKILGPKEGVRLGLGGTIRKIVLPTDDPRVQEIGRINEAMRTEGRLLFAYWNVEYRYSRDELQNAELFQLGVGPVFEPPGELCGTVYDESLSCAHCGAGRKQVSDLILDLRKTPKTKDIACTIASEYIVTQRLAQLLIDARITGCELRPVRHKGRYQDDPMKLERYPSGRELLKQAEAAGIERRSWSFMVWINRPEQTELFRKMTKEHVESMQGKEERRTAKPLPVWYQLVITSAPVEVTEPTRFGHNPFNEDPEGRYRCPLGHVKGLNVLSELSISRETWDGSDVCCTKEMIGNRSGLLVPKPCLLISPRLWRLFEEKKVKGYLVRVAHLVNGRVR